MIGLELFILTNFTSGKVYISYQGSMEDEGGNLIVQYNTNRKPLPLGLA